MSREATWVDGVPWWVVQSVLLDALAAKVLAVGESFLAAIGIDLDDEEDEEP